jgi:hypothetical protein
MLDKYLRDLGDPKRIRRGLDFTWSVETHKISNQKTAIAWQAVSKGQKYYVLFASGRIDRLDEDEMNSHGLLVGKHLAEGKANYLMNIKKRLDENELAWRQAKEMYEEDEKKDDAYEKELRTPSDIPAVEKLRQARLADDLKALEQRRQQRRSDLETKRKSYEKEKKRQEEQLAKSK